MEEQTIIGIVCAIVILGLVYFLFFRKTDDKKDPDKKDCPTPSCPTTTNDCTTCADTTSGSTCSSSTCTCPKCAACKQDVLNISNTTQYIGMKFGNNGSLSCNDYCKRADKDANGNTIQYDTGAFAYDLTNSLYYGPADPLPLDKNNVGNYMCGCADNITTK